MVARWCLAWSFAAFALFPLVLPAADHEFFEKRIRPLLVERCYECHAGEKQKGGLRLDSAAALLRGGDSGAALVPREPEASLLIKAVRWGDPDLQMPPKNKLADSEIAALIDWIKAGAPDPRTNAAPAIVVTDAAARTNHWAYQPVRKPAVPLVRDSSVVQNDVDRFIVARLEAAGLPAGGMADRAILLRRAHYDLTGLPPSEQQLNAFLADSSADSFAMVVDRLLAAPEFGERWGRRWLDVVRFAESVTLRGFVYKEAWRYRDYVIAALNEDMPYDQFVREQIAGDLMPSGSIAEQRRRMIATTFLALGNTNLEEQDKAQLRMDIVDEQLDTIGKAFMAQTIGCARCHDHKFDPVPARDYYAMAGIFRNTKTVTNANVSGWLELPLPAEPHEEEVYRAHEVKLAALQGELKAARDALKALAGSKSTQDANPTVIKPETLAGIVVDSAQAKRVGDWKESQHFKHFIGVGYVHDDASGKGEKTLTFIPELKKAGRYEVRFAYQHAPSRATNVPVTIFHADGETTIHVNQQETPALDGRFVSLGQFRFEGNGFAHVLVANENTRGHVIADAAQFLPVETIVAATSDAAKSVASDAANDRIKRLEAEIKTLRDTGPKRPLMMGVREEEKIEDTYIHIRGSVHNRGDVVPRGFLQVATHSTAPELPGNESGRREFAQWLTDSSHPLTARVMVNRVWHWLFGAGLVRTTDNFGTTGESPSHPELLDYLAVRFMEEGWSVKRLVREIMLSRTYQLSAAKSVGEVQASEVDPENRLLWRAHRRRMDAESLRDAMLFLGGALSAERGGPSFPASLSADYGFQYTGVRRSVYVPVFRNALPDLFEAFDFADPSMVVGVRNVSTVAPQALFLMNHSFVREQARITAQRLIAEKHTDDERLDRLYWMALGRKPTSGETAIARRRLGGDSERSEAWTDIVHALLASAEFRFVN